MKKEELFEVNDDPLRVGSRLDHATHYPLPATFPSFRTQGRDRIDSGGAAGGEPAGDDSDRA